MVARRPCLTAPLILLIAGCGVIPHPVAGRVTLDGQPVSGGVVSFVPDQGKGRPAFAYLRDDGSFDLNTLSAADGAFAGKYKILVMKMVSTDPTGKSTSAVNLLPTKYNDVSKTPLECTVPLKAPLVLELTTR